MNDIRSTNWLKLAIIIALGAAFALGSFWVLEVIRQGNADSLPTASRTDSDYYVEKFNFIRMAQTGEVQYYVSGKRLIHNPLDDSYEIEQPIVSSLGNDRPPITVHAKRALVNDNNSKIHMYDNVQIDRPATASRGPFHLTSEYLLLLPDDDVMQTDKPVEIMLGTSKLSGTGMYANNATRELRLSSNVRVMHQPSLSNTLR